jgi:50S ribosomal protein L16 3-hydroxylase
LKKIRWTHQDVADFLGRFLTTPKPNVVFSPNRGFTGSLQSRTAELHPKTQMLYRGARFFVNGEVLHPRPLQRKVLAGLADRRRAPGAALARAGLQQLILAWHRAGYLDLTSIRD